MQPMTAHLDPLSLGRWADGLLAGADQQPAAAHRRRFGRAAPAPAAWRRALLRQDGMRGRAFFIWGGRLLAAVVVITASSWIAGLLDGAAAQPGPPLGPLGFLLGPFGRGPLG